MNEVDFKKYLVEKEIESQLVTEYINQIRNYEEYLSKENLTLESSLPKKIMDYSDYLVLQDETSVLDFLRAIMHYANYSDRPEFTTRVIDISESYNAMDNLYIRVAKIYGEPLRDEIFQDLTIPKLGVYPEKKPEFTKVVLKRLEEKLGKKKIIDLLSPCLHGRPPDDIEGDKKLLKELGIDGFLEKKHENLVTRLEKHKNEGTLEFAQKIDDEIVQYVRENQGIAQGIRKENIIYVSKLPYQMREYLDAKDDQMKKFYICYCPWIRGALKNGTEKEITKDFCHCSAGWYKLYWEQIFERPIKVEPVKTARNGDMECKFAIHLPDDLLSLNKMN